MTGAAERLGSLGLPSRHMDTVRQVGELLLIAWLFVNTHAH
jgi:hypothetical protein